MLYCRMSPFGNCGGVHLRKTDVGVLETRLGAGIPSATAHTCINTH